VNGSPLQGKIAKSHTDMDKENMRRKGDMGCFFPEEVGAVAKEENSVLSGGD